MRAHPHFRYEEVANLITGLVNSGTLSPGSRAPSLRDISKQQRISLSTALQAYRLLEDRGVLEVRPRSGHYVTRRTAIHLATPTISDPPGKATPVAISATLSRLQQYSVDPRLVPLGGAIPNAELLAAARLDRFLARAARTKGTTCNTYTVPKGDPQLRQEIARRALRWGAALSPEDIVITSGCMEAITLALSMVTRPGDTVAIESPTYFGLLRSLEVLGLKVFELPTDATDGIDLSALKRVLERRSVKACLFASSFNNPLGCTMPTEKKRKVLSLLARHRVPLIEDDIIGDIYFGSEHPSRSRHSIGALTRSFIAARSQRPSRPVIASDGWPQKRRRTCKARSKESLPSRFPARRCCRSRLPSSYTPAVMTIICAGSGAFSKTPSAR